MFFWNNLYYSIQFYYFKLSVFCFLTETRRYTFIFKSNENKQQRRIADKFSPIHSMHFKNFHDWKILRTVCQFAFYYSFEIIEILIHKLSRVTRTLGSIHLGQQYNSWKAGSSHFNKLIAFTIVKILNILEKKMKCKDMKIKIQFQFYSF